MKGILFMEEVFLILGVALEVHRTLAHGFLEGVYRDALIMELRRKGIPYERKRILPVL
jgi:GxxExxY protein